MTPDLRARVRALLERIEWNGQDGELCPICAAVDDRNEPVHTPDCTLAALIEEVKHG